MAGADFRLQVQISDSRLQMEDGRFQVAGADFR